MIPKKIQKNILELYEKGWSYHRISEYCYTVFDLNLTDDAIRYHCKRKFQRKVNKVEQLRADGITKILCLSDIHCPHFNEELIYGIIEKHKDEISAIILNGDIIDCAEISCFPSVGKPKITEEMILCHKMLSKIEQIAPDIPKYIIKGNHEARWEKYLATNESVLNELHSTNILSEIVKGFEVHNFNDNTSQKYGALKNYIIHDSWYLQVLDTIFCHPLTFSKVKGKVATMSIDYFKQQGFDFNNVIVAHTHKSAIIKYFDCIGIEEGCLCDEMKYSNKGKLSYNPQNKGYVLCTFKNGTLDINESRCYFI